MGWCSMAGFPGRDTFTSYAKVRAHFDSVRPWDSKYNPDCERPIGSRSVKLTSDGEHYYNYGDGFGSTPEDRARDREGARFNKAMRLLDRDEKIVFRLYEKDCVTWCRDDSIIIHGHPTVSTSSFIDSLTPMGISHSSRQTGGRGERERFDPVLILSPIVEHVDPPSPWRDEERRWMGPSWTEGDYVRCSWPVIVRFRDGQWRADEDGLQPFSVPTLDKAAAAKLRREYRLADFQRGAAAAIAMRLEGQSDYATPNHRITQIMGALEDGDMATAIDWAPRDQSLSSFMHALRTELYDREDALVIGKKKVLTPGEYASYVRVANRFGISQ